MNSEALSFPQHPAFAETQTKPAMGALGCALLLLVIAQVLLLGTTREITPGKIVYAGLFGAICLIWGFHAFAEAWKWSTRPIFRWVAMVFLLFVFSRWIGAEHHIAGIDWLRELTAFVGYSWIFFVPLLFQEGAFPRKFYLGLVWVLVGFSVANAYEFMQRRGFSSSDSDYVVALNGILSAPIFGYFMTAGLAMGKPKGERRFFILLLGCFFLATLLSGTRTSLISIGVGTTFYSWMLRKERKRSDYGSRLLALWSPMFVSTLLFALLVVSGLVNREAVMDRIEQAMEGTDATTIINRLNEARDAIAAFEQHPFVGQGLGYKVGTVFVVGQSLEPQDDYFVHDFYLYVLCKFGLIGVVVFGGLILSMLRTSVRGYRRSLIPFDRGIYGGAAALVIALLVQSITLNTFSNRASAGVLMLVMGTVAVTAASSQSSMTRLKLEKRT